MPFELPPLPYDKAALEPHLADALTMEIHHDRHHKALRGQSSTRPSPATPRWKASRSEALIGDLGFRAGRHPRKACSVPTTARGHWNHSFFWKILALRTAAAPERAKLGDVAINGAFGSCSRIFRRSSRRRAMDVSGSGWSMWLVSNGGKLEIVSTPNQDTPLMGKAVSGVEGKVILGVDVWEHAYYLKYQNKRADYLKAFWNVVNWAEVAKNF